MEVKMTMEEYNKLKKSHKEECDRLKKIYKEEKILSTKILNEIKEKTEIGIQNLYSRASMDYCVGKLEMKIWVSRDLILSLMKLAYYGEMIFGEAALEDKINSVEKVTISMFDNNDKGDEKND